MTTSEKLAWELAKEFRDRVAEESYYGMNLAAELFYAMNKGSLPVKSMQDVLMALAVAKAARSDIAKK